jgi:hypothetical protein
MALEFMHIKMIDHLKSSGASDEIIERYQSVWNGAMNNSSLPIPCPTCFRKGLIHRLKPLPDKSGISSARCENCKTKFEWSSPD